MNPPTPPPEVTRRDFMQLALGWAAGIFVTLATGAASLRFLIPNVLYEPSQIFKAGRPDDYADGSVTFLEDERVFLVRQGNTFRCLSSTCTHLGCTVNRAEHGYHCPCHGSLFDDQGNVKSGPAPKALPWFQVTLSKDNRLLVDKNQVVPADKYLVL